MCCCCRCCFSSFNSGLLHDMLSASTTPIFTTNYLFSFATQLSVFFYNQLSASITAHIHSQCLFLAPQTREYKQSSCGGAWPPPLSYPPLVTYSAFVLIFLFVFLLQGPLSHAVLRRFQQPEPHAHIQRCELGNCGCILFGV